MGYNFRSIPRRQIVDNDVPFFVGYNGADKIEEYVPFDQADEFDKDWIKDPFSPGDKWADYIRWGEWKKIPDGSIKVEDKYN
ncbi:MAG: hypothetical protein IKP86_11770 [Anaerolineaceae bacterium]|nr:hypothetical protein [Anaerolineaceae bacterium]